MNDATTRALNIARQLARSGVPVFVAAFHPDGRPDLPVGWQQSPADASVVDTWSPGMALCMVTGCGIDVIDVDFYKPPAAASHEKIAGHLPPAIGVAATPSGGLHYFVGPLGVASSNDALPAIDVKAGTADGAGRGFAWIAPTVRISKATGSPEPYAWAVEPDTARIGEVWDSTALRAQFVRAPKPARAAGDASMLRQFITSRAPLLLDTALAAWERMLTAIGELAPDAGGLAHDTIRDCAYFGGSLVAAGRLDLADAQQAVADACADVWGAADSRDWAAITEGFSSGQSRPIPIVATEAEGLAAGAAAAGRWSVFGVVDPSPLDVRSVLDQERAEAVWSRLHPALRYAADVGQFVVRDGTHWRLSADGARWAVYVASRMQPAGVAPDTTKREEWTEDNWRHLHWREFRTSAKASAIASMLTAAVAQNGHYASLYLADLDTEPEILWAGGVPFDLRACSERLSAAQIDPAAPHLHSAAVLPDQRRTPAWDAYCAAVWPDPAVRAWVLRVFGRALTGYPDAALPILYGRARSGKTTFVKMLQAVLGTYGISANPKLLADNAGHDTTIFALKGARLAFIDEGPRRGYQADERLKQLTGGAPLTGRRMRADEITFIPTHTLAMTTNNDPEVTDPALRARIQPIPCEADETAVRPAVERLVAAWPDEAPGVLAGFMVHAGQWLADRRSGTVATAPESIRIAEAALAEGQNTVAEWVTERCVRDEAGTPGRELYHAYVSWWDGKLAYRRRAPLTETAFGRALTDIGHPSVQRGHYWFRALRVTVGGYFGQNEPRSGLRGLDAGPDGDPRGPITPGQSPNLDTSSSGLAGFLRNQSNNINIDSITANGVVEDITEGIVGKTRAEASVNVPESARDLRERDVRGSDPEPAPDKSVTETPTNKSKPKVTSKTDKGNISLDKKLIAQRNREEARQTKIIEAAGAPVRLPALVDRAGRIAELDLADCAAMIGSAGGELGVDVETTGYPIGHADYALRLVQIGTADWCLVFDPDAEDQALFIRQTLEGAHTLYAYSATADIGPLAAAGLGEAAALWARMHDMAPLAILAQPTGGQSDADAGLKATALRYLRGGSVAPAAERAKDALFTAGKWLKKLKIDTPVERSGWANAPKDCATFVRYGASDVLDTVALARVLPDPGDGVKTRERVIGTAVASVSYHGIRLDVDRVVQLADEHAARRAELTERIGAVGIVNPSSPAQVAAWLTGQGVRLPVTDAGNASVKAEVIAGLAAAGGLPADIGDVIAAYAEYVKIGKRLSAFLTPWHVMATRGDGRLRPTIYTLGAEKTGRMSAVRPNMQQVPRVGGYRECIIADPGHLLIGADFGQVEIRMAAILSGDEQLKSMLRDGLKVHDLIAAQVFGPNYTEEHRNGVKRGVFGWLYGGGVDTLAKQLDGRIESAERMKATLSAIAPRLVQWKEAVVQAVKSGQLRHFTTYSGRVIHIGQAHSAPNYMVQGSSRELLGDALIRLQDTTYRGAILLPVHDEAIMQVPEDQAENATKTLIQSMECDMEGVRIVAEPAAPSACWPKH